MTSVAPPTGLRDFPLETPPSGQVMAAMRRWIEAGRFREGEPLPSERVLAKELDVARTTVRSAFEELQRQGLIEATGDRRRRVVRSSTAQTAVLSRTTCIFSDLTTYMQPGRPFPRGWDLFTYGETIRALQGRGIHTLLMSPTRISGDDLVRVLAGRPFGVVLTREVVERADRVRVVEACRAYHVPIVADGDGAELQQVSRVTSDHELGCHLLTRWLLEQGRRRVLRVRPALNPEPDWLQRRDRGFERAMREAGLEPGPIATHPIPDTIWRDGGPVRAVFEANARTVAGHLLEHFRGHDRPDAIVALTDGNARLVAAALRLLGVQPHKDLPIVGYDDTWRDDPEGAFEPEPPDATIDKCNDRVGEALAELLQAVSSLTPETPPIVRRLQPAMVIPEPGAIDDGSSGRSERTMPTSI